MKPDMVDMVITEMTKVMTSSFRKMDFSKTTSGKLAPAELIIIAMTGPSAIPLAMRTWEIGIILDSRI